MHYKNGKEAKSGDAVIMRRNCGEVGAGTLHSLNAGCISCNGQVAIAVPGGFVNEYVTVGEIYSAADALAAMTPVVGTVAAAPDTSASPAAEPVTTTT